MREHLQKKRSEIENEYNGNTLAGENRMKTMGIDNSTIIIVKEKQTKTPFVPVLARIPEY